MSPESGKYLDSIVVIFLLAFLALTPPLVHFWATPASPWYLPYLVWLAIVVLVALVQSRRRRHEL